jgi:flagellar basal body-associated protein FliL
MFLKVIIIAVYSLIGMSCLSVCIIALWLSAKKTEEEIENTKSASQTPLTGDVY